MGYLTYEQQLIIKNDQQNRSHAKIAKAPCVINF